jgi:actin-related protein
MYIPQGFNHQYGIPLIMEVGSLNSKIGFAGKEKPDAIVPSYVQVNKTTSEKTELDFYNSFAKENCDP